MMIFKINLFLQNWSNIVVIVICVDGNMSTFDSHSLADNIELSVTELDKVYKTIVHVEPIWDIIELFRW